MPGEATETVPAMEQEMQQPQGETASGDLGASVSLAASVPEAAKTVSAGSPTVAAEVAKVGLGSVGAQETASLESERNEVEKGSPEVAGLEIPTAEPDDKPNGEVMAAISMQDEGGQMDVDGAEEAIAAEIIEAAIRESMATAEEQATQDQMGTTEEATQDPMTATEEQAVQNPVAITVPVHEPVASAEVQAVQETVATTEEQAIQEPVAFTGGPAIEESVALSVDQAVEEPLPPFVEPAADKLDIQEQASLAEEPTVQEPAPAEEPGIEGPLALPLKRPFPLRNSPKLLRARQRSQRQLLLPMSLFHHQSLLPRSLHYRRPNQSNPIRTLVSLRLLKTM
ncbi:hypothetical protein AAFF_G00010760 [Aldrovandia affinis]|uniref:Uncharacterized protein n=1 Tax=Aldrovandia affinis TaxID=143900 RepID=A0AAD7S6R2_9TELE|nr:hypothetical protein AAFF_G00010760 [Aldrovandia affinis]